MKIMVGMGEMAIWRTPGIISSVGIGSCIVITIYDTGSIQGGWLFRRWEGKAEKSKEVLC